LAEEIIPVVVDIWPSVWVRELLVFWLSLLSPP